MKILPGQSAIPPLARLGRISGKASAELVVKLESFNPPGCVKERIGFAIIEDAKKRHALRKDGVIIEPAIRV